MAKHFGDAMQNYNSELVKCIEELKHTRTKIHEEIEAEETERNALQKEIERMSSKINQLSESLLKKSAIRKDYDRTIQEAESACTKILESSQLLLNMVKREAADLCDTLHSTERTETVLVGPATYAEKEEEQDPLAW